MKRLTRLAVGAGAALGLSAWLAPAAGAEGLPHWPQFPEGAATSSSSRPTTRRGTRSWPTTAPTTAP